MLKLLIAALLATPMLSAQVVTAHNCVHQVGDNPDWARPDFDDRQWSKQSPETGSPYVWTRCRVDLSSLPPTLPVHIGVVNSAPWELFVDGKPAGSFGNIHTGLGSATSAQHVVPAGAVTGMTITLALRQLPARLYRAVPPGLAAGPEDSLRVRNSARVSAMLWARWSRLVVGGFSLIIGVLLLLLYVISGDRNRRELLWFGLYCLMIHSITAGGLAQILSSLPYAMSVFWYALSGAIFALVSPRIFFALSGRRLPVFYSGLAMAAAGVSLLLASARVFTPIHWMPQVRPWLNLVSDVLPLLDLTLQSSAAAAFWPVWRVPGPLRLARNLSLLVLLGSASLDLTQLSPLGLSRWATLGASIQPILILTATIGLFIVIARRHREVALDRAELQGEMKAAQEVQRLLTSSTLDAAPWASVEVAYSPAKEVGGDFYFCRQTPEGQLIVVGDVSGKGLRAAMLASVALGALRHSSVSSPGPLLQGLNAALHGQTGGGFVTCCAALMRSDGQLIVANAGHPSAYVDGREFPVEAGLPLGIVPDATYEETSGKAESITLVSDGVVEAENAQRELFGFDRTREISAKSAREIAEAAKAWGQTDDITVVTVRRNA
jgi:sigma-B regulation protein RsbU (phosphoserine phosphatase)